MDGDLREIQWAILAVVFSVFVAVRTRKTYGVFAALLVGWMTLSGVLIMTGQSDSINAFGSRTRNQFLALSGSSVSFLLLFVLVAHSYRSSWNKWIQRTIAVSSAAGAVYIIAQYAMGARGQGLTGILDQSAMSGCMVVVGFPFWARSAHRLPWIPFAWLGVMLGLLLLEPQSSTPMGAAIVCFVAYLTSSRWHRWGLFDIVVSGTPVVVGLGFLAKFINPLFFDDSYRFQFWKFFMREWWERANVWTGTGFGTAALHLAGTQMFHKYNTENNLWLWLHSDFLQLAYELGFVGLALGVAVFVAAVVRAYRARRHELVAAIVTAAAVGSVQYPLRLGPFATLIAFLLMSALYDPRPTEPGRCPSPPSES